MIVLPGYDGAMCPCLLPPRVYHPVHLLPGMHCQSYGVSEHPVLCCCVHGGVYLIWVTSLLLAPELAFISLLSTSHLVFSLFLLRCPTQWFSAVLVCFLASEACGFFDIGGQHLALLCVGKW